MNVCKIQPTIKTKTGEEIPSPLYSEIMQNSKLNAKETRKIAVTFSLLASKGAFNNLKGIITNEYGEPTFLSLLSETNLGELIGYKNSDKEKYKIGSKLFSPENSKVQNTSASYTSMIETAIKYNNENSEYTLLVQHNDEKNTLFYVLLPKTSDTENLAKQMQQQHLLHNKLMSILEASGIAVGTLTEAEKRMRVNGVTAFGTAKVIGEGIVELIRLQDGSKGYFALPEEFSHWLVDATRDEVYTQRLLNHIKNNNLIKEILGVKYDYYVEKYQGDEEALLNEAASHLIANRLTGEEPISNTSNNILKKFFNWLKSLFNTNMQYEVQKALREAKNYASVIANQVLDGTFEKKRRYISNRVIRDLYQLDTSVSNVQKKIEKEAKNIKLNTDISKYIEEQAKKKQQELFPSTSIKIPLYDAETGQLISLNSNTNPDKWKELFTRMRKQEAQKNAQNEEIKRDVKWLNAEEKLLVEKDYSESNLSDLIKDLIRIEQKRYRIYAKHPSFEENFLRNQYDLISSLTSLGELEALITYINSINVRLRENLIKLDSLDYKSNANNVAGILVNIRRYLTSYESQLPAILLKINEMYRTANSNDRLDLLDDAKDLIEQSNTLFIQVQSLYDQHAIPIFASFLKPILGDSIENPLSKTKQKMTLEEYIKHIPKDISMTDMLFDTLSQSSEPILQAYDRIFAEAATDARLSTINFLRQKLFPFANKLKSAGFSNYNWAFERDEEGNFTDYYIDEVRWGAYYKAKEEEISRLKELHPDDDVAQSAGLRAWMKKNTGHYGKPRAYDEETNQPLWVNPEYERLTETQKELLEEFKTLKGHLERMLPMRRIDVHNTIKIRKDMLERINSGESAEGLMNSIKTSVQDEFIRRCDDEAFGISTITDFDDRPVMSLPLFYTNRLKNDTPNDISTDLVSTLAAYAMMAYNYDAVHKISSGVNLGLKVLSDVATVGLNSGKNPIYEIHTKQQVVKPFVESKIYKRLVQASKHAISGISKEDEGTWGNSKIDKRKSADFVNKYTALTSYAFNGLSGLANVLNGRIMQRVEASGGDFFTNKDLIEADKIYVRDIAPYLAERGEAIKSSKMELWIEKFNILYEFKNKTSNMNFDRNNITRNGSDFYLYFMDKSGNHWLNVRTSLAVSNNRKLKDGENEISIYDAYETVTNEHGITELKLKKGLKTQDGLTIVTEEELRERAKLRMENMKGLRISFSDPSLVREGEISEFTFINKFSMMVSELNTLMMGNYNPETMVYAKSFAVGALVMMYRNYLKPALNYRFAAKQKNYRLDKEIEGYYRTVGRCFLRLVRELRSGVAISSLNTDEKKNFKRAATDAVHVLAFALILAFILDKDDDDEEPSWIMRMLDYMIRRLYRELGSLTPSHLMLIEGRQILKSPAAGINTLENIIGLFGLLNPFNWEFIAGEDAIIKTGIYKGMSKARKALIKATPIKTIRRFINPEEATISFKNTQNF